jgi:5-methylcytosine-specific restriction endonuclease McrA
VNKQQRTITVDGVSYTVSMNCGTFGGRYPTHWALTRVGVMIRDKLACRACGSHMDLTVAHLNHDKHDMTPANLKTLCRQCHTAHDMVGGNIAPKVREYQYRRQAETMKRIWAQRRNH